MLAFLHLRQDLAAARQLRDVAISGLQTAQDAQKTAQDTLQFVQTRWEEAVQAKDNEAAEKWEEKVKRAEEKVERAEVKVETAEKKVDRAEVELDRAKQEVDKAKEAAKASVPAGRGQAGASACAVVAALPQGRRAFSCGPPLLLFGVMLSSQQGFRSSLSRFHCVGLQHFGEREGLLAASGFTQIWLPFAFCRRFRTGCQS